jgi:hypothetical protein
MFKVHRRPACRQTGNMSKKRFRRDAHCLDGTINLIAKGEQAFIEVLHPMISTALRISQGVSAGSRKVTLWSAESHSLRKLCPPRLSAVKLRKCKRLVPDTNLLLKYFAPPELRGMNDSYLLLQIFRSSGAFRIHLRLYCFSYCRFRLRFYPLESPLHTLNQWHGRCPSQLFFDQAVV